MLAVGWRMGLQGAFDWDVTYDTVTMIRSEALIRNVKQLEPDYKVRVPSFSLPLGVLLFSLFRDLSSYQTVYLLQNDLAIA